MFPCKQCGECCRHIGTAFFAKDMMLPNGTCKFLDEATNLCKQYETRPIFCNVDAYYEKYLQTVMSREAFYQKNIEACEKIRGERNG